jgi:hypothetical protein
MFLVNHLCLILQEGRDIAQLNRLSGQVAGAEAAQNQAASDRTGAITGAIGGVISTVGSMYSAGAFNGSAPAASGGTTTSYNAGVARANSNPQVDPLTGSSVALMPRR